MTALAVVEAQRLREERAVKEEGADWSVQCDGKQRTAEPARGECVGLSAIRRAAGARARREPLASADLAILATPAGALL